MLLAGPSGSGKTHLAEESGLPLLDLDDFYEDGGPSPRRWHGRSSSAAGPATGPAHWPRSGRPSRAESALLAEVDRLAAACCACQPVRFGGVAQPLEVSSPSIGTPLPGVSTLSTMVPFLVSLGSGMTALLVALGAARLTFFTSLPL